MIAEEGFDIEMFLQESIKKIGKIHQVEITYGQYDDYRAKLVITAFNGNHPLKLGDYNCESIMEFLFGEGMTDEKYVQSKCIANKIRAYIKRNFPDVRVYRSTKCTFAWFDDTKGDVDYGSNNRELG